VLVVTVPVPVLASVLVGALGYLSLAFVRVVADRTRDEVVEPGPIEVVELGSVALDLRRFLSDAFGEHEAHPAARLVRRYAFQVAIARNLLVAGRLAV